MDMRLDKRIAPRRNTMILATIVFNGGLSKMDCVIRNLSTSGAKLEVPVVKVLPQTFDLIVPRHKPMHCTVAWRAMRELGVAFSEPW
jgi:hypothetical protein